MAEKGDEIRFIRGSYEGFIGWINKSKKTKKKKSSRRFVIVLLDDGTEKQTWVKKNSYRKRHSDPASYEEAALQQHSDMELTMIKLAEMFAEIGTSNFQEVVRLFYIELEIAYKNQKELGNKARFRNVEFDHDN